MAGYNLTRTVDELLRKHGHSPPSFSVRLHPDYWTLNNGPKFLYNNQTASLLDDIRAQRIPVDFLELFDDAKLPFYDGCMIVELLDYRPVKVSDPVLEVPERTRVVLTPNDETMWADICLMNKKAGGTWTDRQAMEMEARLLLLTAPPLCLDPDPHLTRMINNTMRIAIPTAPPSLKRKAAVMELEEEEIEKARRAKLMQYMNPKNNRPATPNYRVLESIQRMKNPRPAIPPQIPTSAPPHPALPNTLPGPIPVHIPATAPPVAFAHPGVAPTPVPIPTSSSPVNTPQNGQVAQKMVRKTDTGQSPRVGSGSATPVTSVVPLPIPPHMQSHYPAHVALQTPPRTATQSPHPPSSAPMSTPSPNHAETRPSSRSQLGPPQPNQQAGPSQPQQPDAAAQAQPVVNSYQSLVTANFMAQQHAVQQAAMTKKKAQQPAAANSKVVPPFQQPAQQGAVPPQPHPHLNHAQVLFAQQYYPQHAVAQQRLNQPQSQSAAPATRSPMPAHQAAPQRGSPLAATQPLTSRSPNPPPAQQQAHNFNYALYHNNSPAMRTLPQQQAPDQAQAQLMAQYPMYYRAPVGMNMQAALPPNYWQMGMGRGAPVASGQHPAMAHPQQMQLAPGKAVQGGGL